MVLPVAQEAQKKVTRKKRKRLQGKMFLYAVTQRYFKDQNFLIIVLFQRWLSKNLWADICEEQTGRQVLSSFFESWVNTFVIKLGHYWPQQKREYLPPRDRWKYLSSGRSVSVWKHYRMTDSILAYITERQFCS